eukprot:507306-Rhodomonas_salina.1
MVRGPPSCGEFVPCNNTELLSSALNGQQQLGLHPIALSVAVFGGSLCRLTSQAMLLLAYHRQLQYVTRENQRTPLRMRRCDERVDSTSSQRTQLTNTALRCYQRSWADVRSTTVFPSPAVQASSGLLHTLA